MQVTALPADFAEALVPDPGQMVDAEGWLQVVAEHEWDAFRIPDSRMDWRIHRIRLVKHHMVPTLDEHPGAVTLGPIVNVTQLDRLDRAAEGRMNTRYVVDLAPA